MYLIAPYMIKRLAHQLSFGISHFHYGNMIHLGLLLEIGASLLHSLQKYLVIRSRIIFKFNLSGIIPELDVP